MFLTNECSLSAQLILLQLRKSSCFASQNNTLAHTTVPYTSFSAVSCNFNSLHKVLFVFPSRYLFSIGLPPACSLKRGLPFYLRFSSKKRYSTKASRTWKTTLDTSVLLFLRLCSKKLSSALPLGRLCKTTIQESTFLISNLGFSLFIRH